ncbi:MAG: hypothetical protein AAF591_07725 [Verrucomicrobiota bacterium]
MNLSDLLIGVGAILFVSIFSAIGVGLIYLRFKDRGFERFEGEIVGNEWQSESAEMGGSFHPQVRISKGAETLEFVDQSGQVPARKIGEKVEVICDKESGEFRILRSWLTSWILGLLFISTGLLAVMLTLKSCRDSPENGANKGSILAPHLARVQTAITTQPSTLPLEFTLVQV